MSADEANAERRAESPRARRKGRRLFPPASFVFRPPAVALGFYLFGDAADGTIAHKTPLKTSCPWILNFCLIEYQFCEHGDYIGGRWHHPDFLT